MRLTRTLKEYTAGTWTLFSVGVVLLMPLLLGIGIALKALPIFEHVTLTEMLTSGEWQPSSGKFGFLPFIVSSLVVTAIGLILMIPFGLLPAIYLTQYAPPRTLKVMRSVIDILAGIPSVIHGVWGVLIVVPLVSVYIAPIFGVNTTGYTILAGGIVLAIATLPFVLHMLLEVFRSIPMELKEASLSLGATYWETIKKVVLRKAFPGIIAAFALGVSKAFGETIAVLMVVGNIVQLPTSMFDAGYPLPALIANNYGEMLSIPMYDAALMFAALVLFIIVLIFNIFSRLAIQRTTQK
ncbi:MAG TPA: phosphate ABC transporter permease subunit PstC [Cyclobacteriaceae bacterium]|jgi:phosphate transport system permease protein|nr:phosphate ABC transporter permease subunit PstC [Cyclobacteriaceae bacterium]